MRVKVDMKKDRTPLAFIVRTPATDRVKLDMQLDMLNRYHQVDVYSFYPILSKYAVKQFPSGTSAQNFTRYLEPGKYKMAVILGDNNSNIYTMQQTLKKSGIALLTKMVLPLVTEEKAPVKEEEPKPDLPDTTIPVEL